MAGHRGRARWLPPLVVGTVVVLLSSTHFGSLDLSWGNGHTVWADGGSTLPPPDLTPAADSRTSLVQPPRLPEATLEFDARSVMLDGVMEARSVTGRTLLILPTAVELQETGGTRQVIVLPVASAAGESLAQLTDPRGRISLDGESGARRLTLRFGPGDRGTAVFRVGEFTSTAVSNQAEVLDVVVTLLPPPNAPAERGRPEVSLTTRLPRLPTGLRLGIIPLPVGPEMTAAAAESLEREGLVLDEVFGAYDAETNLDPSLGDAVLRVRESADAASIPGAGALMLVNLTDEQPYVSALRPSPEDGLAFAEAPIQSGYATYLLVRAAMSQVTPDEDPGGPSSNVLVTATVILLTLGAAATAVYLIRRRRPDPAG